MTGRFQFSLFQQVKSIWITFFIRNFYVKLSRDAYFHRPRVLDIMGPVRLETAPYQPSVNIEFEDGVFGFHEQYQKMSGFAKRSTRPTAHKLNLDVILVKRVSPIIDERAYSVASA